MSGIQCCCSQNPFKERPCVNFSMEFQKLSPDVLICVKNRCFATHRNLLAYHSDYFRDFFETIQDDSPFSVHLIDASVDGDSSNSSLLLDADCFSLILDWMYTDRIELTSSTAAAVFVASQKLSIESLLQTTRLFMLRYALCHPHPSHICSLLANVDPSKFLNLMLRQISSCSSSSSRLLSVEPLIEDAIRYLVNEAQPFSTDLVIVSVVTPVDGVLVHYEVHMKSGSDRLGKTDAGIANKNKRTVTVHKKIHSSRTANADMPDDKDKVTKDDLMEQCSEVRGQDAVSETSKSSVDESCIAIWMPATIRMMSSSEFSIIDFVQGTQGSIPTPPPLPPTPLWAPKQGNTDVNKSGSKNIHASKIPVKQQQSGESLPQSTDELFKSDKTLKELPAESTSSTSKLMSPRKRHHAPPPPSPSPSHPQAPKTKSGSRLSACVSRFGWRGSSSSPASTATGRRSTDEVTGKVTPMSSL